MTPLVTMTQQQPTNLAQQNSQSVVNCVSCAKPLEGTPRLKHRTKQAWQCPTCFAANKN